MKQTWDNSLVEDLATALLMLQDRAEAKMFLRDLLTPKEIMEFSARWQVARMLNEQTSYADIERQTRMSSTTIARVSKFLKGNYGGYRLVLDRLSSNHHHHHADSVEERL
jgi:TrpR-related protein YerC/YecD